MTEEPITETSLPRIERSKPKGPGHPLATQEALGRVNSLMEGKQDMVSLADYLGNPSGKTRGTKGGKEDLNSHFEEFIIREDGEIKVLHLLDLQQKLALRGLDVELLGVASIGNVNQKVTSRVHGVDKNNLQSGYERPTVEEGPHMILAPYAIDNDGQLHIFRTIQYRTGESVIDTPRGFADSKSLEAGKQMYEVEGVGERVKANMTRIIGEEAGKNFLI